MPWITLDKLHWGCKHVWLQPRLLPIIEVRSYCHAMHRYAVCHVSLKAEHKPCCPGRLKIGGSNIGGIKETQDMLDFCGKHNITCEIETIDANYVNTAYERLMKNDVHYRFVIDIQGSLIQ